jgi:FkbM family methyltransferase
MVMFGQLGENFKRTPIGRVLHRWYLKLRFGDGTVVLVSNGPLVGMRFRKYLRTFSPEFVTGDYEAPLSAALTRELRPGQTFYDVGANVGFFSLLASKITGPTGKVIAFEPHPETIRQLRAQFEVNSLANTQVVEAAVSDRVGSTTLIDGFACMVKMSDLEPTLGEPNTITAATTTLDDVAGDVGFPDVVKMDIEGAEILALRGAATVLNRKPTLLVEVHSEQLSREFYPLLEGFGYDFYRLDGTPIEGTPYVRFVMAK